MSKTERAKMTAGEPYQQFDPELIERRKFIRQRIQQLNQEVDNEQRNQGFKKLLGDVGDDFLLKVTLNLITDGIFTSVTTFTATTT